MKLIQEIEKITGYSQSDLKSSDGSSAGKDDVAAKTADVKFSLMRNVINTQNGVTGSDVSNYLERAHELNDEVDTVGFVVETDDNDFIKIYVNATQADEFEKEMANLLGLEDDPEAAINTLAQKFDIVDVVWPQDPEGEEDGITIDNADELGQTDEPADAEPSTNTETASDEQELEATLSSSETVSDTSNDTSAGAEEDPPEEQSSGEDESAEKDNDESASDESSDDEDDEGNTDSSDGKKKKKKDLSKLADAAKQKFEEGRYFVEAFVPGDTDRNVGVSKYSFMTEAAATAHLSSLPKLDGAQYRIIDRGEHTYVAEETSAVTESTTETQGETDMTIGSQFLKRVLQEAEDRDGVIDGMNIPLDSQYRALVAQLKRPIEKKLVALYAMTGIPGRYVNSVDGIKDRVTGAGDMLRKNTSVRRAFDEFYSALATAKGFAPQTSNAVTERLIAESKVKRGSFIQKKMETILTMLGLPEDIVTSEGPGVAAPALYRTAKLIDQSAELQAAMNKLAIRMGIKAVDAVAPVGESVVAEDVDVGNDEFFQKVVALAVALGIPERNMQFQRPALVKSLREKKMSLQARGMIETRMDQLLAMIEKNTRKMPGNDGA